LSVDEILSYPVPLSAVVAEICAGGKGSLYINNLQIFFMILSAVDITVLLALSVYQLVVSDSLPVTFQSVGESGARVTRFL